MADGYMEGWRGWRLMGANKFYDDSSVVYWQLANCWMR
jgi:hypothetical protein